MKLLKQSDDGWEYGLNQQEAKCLEAFLKEFPLTPASAVKVTKTESGRATAERERLLNESLAEHRGETKRKAANFLASGKLKAGQNGWRLRVNAPEREMLLQLLNDIRVGCWRALGEPENIETQLPHPSEREFHYYNLMQLAGYFEVTLLNLQKEAN